MALHVVIMAGGTGVRFWPQSRRQHPKQFLRLVGRQTLFEQTLTRALRLTEARRCWVVGSVRHERLLRESLASVPEAQLLLEPVGRNTAPCIAWATAEILRVDPDAVIAVLPSDHFIEPLERFVEQVELAAKHAESAVVLFGVPPTRPETGFGYIFRADAPSDATPGAYAVRAFREKPNAATAEEFLADGRYLWNSGMFFFRGALMRGHMQTHMPDTWTRAERIARDGRVSDEFAAFEAESIDYGVIERISGCLVIPTEFRWSDLGSWEAVRAFSEGKGEVPGPAMLNISSSGCFAAGPGEKLVAFVGVDDVIVVDTEDALLVVRADASQSVREVVTNLERQGRKDLL